MLKKIPTPPKLFKEKTGALAAALSGMLAAGAVNAFFMLGGLAADISIATAVPLLVIFSAIAFVVGLIGVHSLSEHYGYRGVVSMGTAFIVATFLVMAFWGNNQLVAVSFAVVASCGFGLVFPTVYTICIGWFPKRLAFASGIMLALFFAGGGAFYFLARFLLTALGEAGGMFVLGLAYFFVMFFLWYFLQRAPADSIELALKYGIRERLPFGELTRVCTISLALGAALLPLTRNVDLLWQSVESSNPAAFTSLALPAFRMWMDVGSTWLTIFGSALGALLAGIIGDSLDKRRLIAVCGALAIVATIAMWLTKNYAVFIAAATIVSICWGSALCISLAMAAKIFQRYEMLKVSGLLMSTYAFALVLGVVVRLPQKTVRVPFAMLGRGEIVAFPPRGTGSLLVEPDVLYAVAVTLCVIAVVVAVSWRDYNNRKKRYSMIS